MTQEKSKIFISACTFRREQGLTDLLHSFRDIRVPDDCELTVIIVDNDVTNSSQAVFERETQDFPWPCRYVHEPEPGIPIARNRAITTAGQEGYLVFVDDDETVTEDWIVELWRVAKETQATFVQGPVRMLVDDTADNWWLRTLFFSQKSYVDGAKRTESWSNNVLVDLQFIAENNCRFEDRLRYDGGSDTLFFQDIVRCGGTGAFAANAWVCEVQPAGRLTWKWAVKRQFRYGSTRAMTVLLRKSRLEATLYCLVRGSAMAAVGIGCLATAVLRGRLGIANGVALLSRSAGILAGMVGRRTLEYAR
jgi:succinoglycan biosynthesis protein ExoM